MVDPFSPERRSYAMSRVPSQHTSPEIRVRRVAHRLGLRFRLHRRDLPGTPDLVFPRFRIALFVHGCFWHQHPGCRRSKAPKSRVEYWQAKFSRNFERDRQVADRLRAAGWRVEVVWECETKNPLGLAAMIGRLFGVSVTTLETQLSLRK